jgi:hypothetical protein
MERAGGMPAWCPRALAWTAAAVLWFDPTSGVVTAILAGAGGFGLWNWRRTLVAWKNPVGLLWGLGVLWALASLGWSFHPAGSARDLVKAAPMALAALAVPVIFDRPGRVWGAVTASAVLITARLALDLVRIFRLLGWSWALVAARYLHPYLYTHPNVSSMMAGLCALVFAAWWLTGAPRRGGHLLLALGLALDLVYLGVMASRGPQLIFVLAMLAFPLILLPGWRLRLVAAVLAVALGAGLWQVLPKVNPRFRDRTMVDFNQRGRIWSHVRRLAARQPVQGYGFGKKAFVKAVYEHPEVRPPRAPFRYPHAHSYWLMLVIQGGAVGTALWGLGWLALVVRLGRCAARAERQAKNWLERLRARLLPALLATGMGFILVYGIGDYPDNVIRHAQFFLAGLALAWTLTVAGRSERVT